MVCQEWQLIIASSSTFKNTQKPRLTFCQANTQYGNCSGFNQFRSVQLLGRVWPLDGSTPGLPVHHHLPELAQTHVHPVRDAIQPSHPLSSPSPRAFNLSQQQGLFNKSALCIRWPKNWSFSFNISPSNENSGLISFGIEWLDLLAVQGTLKSLLQHCSSKASVNRLSAFIIVQLSHPYMTTGKTTALTRQTFVGKVTSLLLNTLSRLVIAFLPMVSVVTPTK